MGTRIIGYAHNPACPECNGLAGKLRYVAYGTSWGVDFSGDRAGRKNHFERKPLHCRRCAISAPETE